MCYEYIYCCCCYSYGCCCLVFGALSCGKRSKSHLGPKTIEIFAHIHRMVTECECECECPLSTSRPTVRIVVLFEQWAVCDDPGVCCSRCSIVSRVGSKLQVELELEFEIPLIMLRRSQVINLISHNALPGSIKGSIDDPSREQEVEKERGCPRVAIECLSLCNQPDVWVATVNEIAILKWEFCEYWGIGRVQNSLLGKVPGRVLDRYQAGHEARY